MGRPEFETRSNMKTVGLMILLAGYLWIRGEAVIMDRGFYILKRLSEMKKNGFYRSTVIKKKTLLSKGDSWNNN